MQHVRRIRILGLIGILCCAVSLALVSNTTATAMSMMTGSQKIGRTPIMLSQPTDPDIGKLVPNDDADRVGMFGPQVDWPIVPIHAAIARDGALITYGTPLGQNTVQGGLLFDRWQPTSGFAATAHTDSDSMGYDSFCNSLIALANGSLLMVGGNSSMSTMVYNPTTGATMMGANLNHQRWYATTLHLPDGRILVLGGSDTYNRHTTTGLPMGAADGTTPEIGDGINPWQDLAGAANITAFGLAGTHWFYPRAFNGPQGAVVGFSGRQLWTLNPAGQGSLTLTGKLPYDPGPSGSQVMYAPGQVLVASGGSHGPVDTRTASNRALIINFNNSKPKISNTGNVLFQGNWLNLTVLPNGLVFANGGTRVGTAAGTDNTDLTAETWNPTTGTWTAAATAQRTRTYHSVSLLLPSGAVYTGGGGAAPYTGGSDSGPENNMNAELYYPAALFTRGSDGRVHWAKRPNITSISGSATHGGTMHLGLKTTASIKGASLISLPSVTHSENTDQRRIPLHIKQHGRALDVTLPKNFNVLPPGDYELTVVNSHGVPSPAQIITIRRGAPGLITTPPTH